jgi:hypothetical protein
MEWTSLGNHEPEYRKKKKGDTGLDRYFCYWRSELVAFKLYSEDGMLYCHSFCSLWFDNSEFVGIEI